MMKCYNANITNMNIDKMKLYDIMGPSLNSWEQSVRNF